VILIISVCLKSILLRFFIGPKDTKKYGIRGYHLAPFREQGDVPTPLFSSVLQ
jgi:hypothetical protein